MYWYGDHREIIPNQNKRCYMEAVDYGIRCDYNELEKVIGNVKKYLKQTKIRQDGLRHVFGAIHIGNPETQEFCFSEWNLKEGAMKYGTYQPNQGMMWEFVIRPNRHIHVLNNGKRRDCWAAPDHKEFDYIVEMRKRNYYFLEDGKRVETDTPEVRAQREEFFDGLLKSVGYELVPLYEYEPDEITYGCRECGTWYLNPANDNIEPYKHK